MPTLTLIDDFNRADTGAGGTVGSGWTETNTATPAWRITSGQAVPPTNLDFEQTYFGANGGVQSLLLRPESFYNGVVRVRLANQPSAGNVGKTYLPLRVQPNGETVGAFYDRPNINNIGFFANVPNGVFPGYYNYGWVSDANQSFTTAALPVFFEAEAAGNQIFARLIAADGVTVLRESVTTLVGVLAALPAGKYGLAPGSGQPIDAFYSENNDAAATGLLLTGVATVDVGGSEILTIKPNGTLASNAVVSFAAPAGSVFPASVTLTPAQPIATATFFAPVVAAGTVVEATATAPGLATATKPFTAVAPSSRVLYVGDSITEEGDLVRTCNALLMAWGASAKPVIGINRGRVFATSAGWLPGNGAGTMGIPAAIYEANRARCTVANIMLGTNDSKVSENVSKAAYKANLLIIIGELFAKIATLKRVVLQYPITPAPWFADTATFNPARIQDFHAAIDEIATLPAYTGRVEVGAKSGYQAIAENPTMLSVADGIHLQPLAVDPRGVLVTATAWAQGIARALGIGASGAGAGSFPTVAQIQAGVRAELAPELSRVNALPANVASVADVQITVPAPVVTVNPTVLSSASANAIVSGTGTLLDAKLPPARLSKIDGAQQGSVAVTLPTPPPAGYGGGAATSTLVAVAVRIRDADGSPVGGADNHRVRVSVGDTTPGRRVQVVDADDRPMDLTGASVQYSLKQKYAMVGATPQEINAPAVVEPGTGGYLRYEWATTGADTDTVGTFVEQWIVTLPGGRKFTAPSANRIIVEIR